MPEDAAPTFDPIATATALSQEFAATAAARDREGGVPKHERDRLRASGLLPLLVPREWGGHGASWATILHTVRIIARADGSLAHVYGYHHLQLATVRLFGTAAQFERWARGSVERGEFWGNALNPQDDRSQFEVHDAGRILTGEKSFCSGARDADKLIVSGIDRTTDRMAVAVIPADRPGVHPRGDWNNMGQRQTDSGSIVFDRVVVHEDELLTQPGPLGSVFASTRPFVAQLLLSNIYLGIAEGALAAGRAATLERGRAYFASGVERHGDDPYVLAMFGDAYAELEAARLVTDAAGAAFDHAWQQGDDLTDTERGQVSVAIAVAKVTNTRAGLDVTNRIFEATGARATASRYALDRYWRDLRTHTLHDPVDYKRKDLGRFVLHEALPAPTFYS